MNHPLVILKNPNGSITVKNGLYERSIDIRELTPDRKIAEVRAALLDIGEVWSEQTEKRVLKAISS